MLRGQNAIYTNSKVSLFAPGLTGFLSWLFLITPSAHLNAKTTLVESHVKEILVAEIDMIPRGPGAIARGNCIPFSIVPNGAQAKRISSKGWLVTSEINYGPFELISFAGQAESATSGSCIFGQTNIAVFEKGRLLALFYSGNENDHVLAGMEQGKSSAVKVIANGGIPFFSYEIVFRRNRVTLDQLGFEAACGGDIVPDLRDLDIVSARNLLEEYGWKPDVDQYDEFYASVRTKLELPELVTCSGTGVGYCKFFYETSSSILDVSTAGGLMKPDGPWVVGSTWFCK